MYQNVGIADQQKVWKKGRDDSIKQFSTQFHPVHIFNVIARRHNIRLSLKNGKLKPL